MPKNKPFTTYSFHTSTQYPHYWPIGGWSLCYDGARSWRRYRLLNNDARVRTREQHIGNLQRSWTNNCRCRLCCLLQGCFLGRGAGNRKRIACWLSRSPSQITLSTEIYFSFIDFKNLRVFFCIVIATVLTSGPLHGNIIWARSYVRDTRNYFLQTWLANVKWLLTKWATLQGTSLPEFHNLVAAQCGMEISQPVCDMHELNWAHTFSSLVVDSGWGKGLSWWVVSTTEGSSILFLIIGVARGDKSRGIWKN